MQGHNLNSTENELFDFYFKILDDDADERHRKKYSILRKIERIFFAPNFLHSSEKSKNIIIQR